MKRRALRTAAAVATWALRPLAKRILRSLVDLEAVVDPEVYIAHVDAAIAASPTLAGLDERG